MKDFPQSIASQNRQSTVDGDASVPEKPDQNSQQIQTDLGTEVGSDLTKPTTTTNSNNLVATMDSHHQQEKLLLIDLDKIRNNLYNKLNNVCSRFRTELDVVRNTGASVVGELEEDPGVNNEIIQESKQIPNDSNVAEEELDQIANKENDADNEEEDDEDEEEPDADKQPENKINGAGGGGAGGKNDAETHNVKLLKKIAFRSFEQSLAKYGFQINNKNSFIAEGGFGTVVRVYKDGRKFACKVISNILFRLKSERGHVSTVKMHSRFANEVEIMQMVSRHPNIVQFINSFRDEIRVRKVKCGQKSKLVLEDSGRTADNSQDSANDENNLELSDSVTVSGVGENYSEQSDDNSNQLVFKSCFIIMEYANARTLSAYMKNRRSLPEEMVKDIFRQVTSAVQFLHENRIVHRDIKLSNLLMQRRTRFQGRFNYIVKLCDFGLSNLVDSDEDGTFMKPVGTSFYMAPEILRAYYYYNCKRIDRIVPYCGYKGDIWALGVCLFYCLHGYYPLDILCKCNKQERIKALEKIFGDIDETVEQSECEEYEESASTAPAILGTNEIGDQNETELDQQVNYNQTNYDNHNNYQYYYGNNNQKDKKNPRAKGGSRAREIDYEAIRSQNNAIRKVLKNYYQKIGYNCKEILNLMLEVDSDKRANIEQVRMHSFFKK